MIGGIFAPFSAVFYPITALPQWAQNISWCLPTTYIFEGMRILLYIRDFSYAIFLDKHGTECHLFIGFDLSL